MTVQHALLLVPALTLLWLAASSIVRLTFWLEDDQFQRQGWVAENEPARRAARLREALWKPAPILGALGVVEATGGLWAELPGWLGSRIGGLFTLLSALGVFVLLLRWQSRRTARQAPEVMRLSPPSGDVDAAQAFDLSHLTQRYDVITALLIGAGVLLFGVGAIAQERVTLLVGAALVVATLTAHTVLLYSHWRGLARGARVHDDGSTPREFKRVRQFFVGIFPFIFVGARAMDWSIENDRQLLLKNVGLGLEAIVAAVIAISIVNIWNTREYQLLKIERHGSDEATFVAHFESLSVPSTVSRETYQWFQRLGIGVPDFPVLPDDKISGLYGIDAEDVDDMITELMKACDCREPTDAEWQASTDPEAVEELVLFLNRLHVAQTHDAEEQDVP